MTQKKKKNLTAFTCESHTLTNWTLKLNPMPLDTLVVHWIFEEKFNVKKGPIQGFNQFVGLTYQGNDIVFKFIIKDSSLKDFGP
jgi:hypothetical protein